MFKLTLNLCLVLSCKDITRYFFVTLYLEYYLRNPFPVNFCPNSPQSISLFPFALSMIHHYTHMSAIHYAYITSRDFKPTSLFLTNLYIKPFRYDSTAVGKKFIVLLLVHFTTRQTFSYLKLNAVR